MVNNMEEELEGLLDDRGNCLGFLGRCVSVVGKEGNIAWKFLCTGVVVFRSGGVLLLESAWRVLNTC